MGRPIRPRLAPRRSEARVHVRNPIRVRIFEAERGGTVAGAFHLQRPRGSLGPDPVADWLPAARGLILRRNDDAECGNQHEHYSCALVSYLSVLYWAADMLSCGD